MKIKKQYSQINVNEISIEELMRPRIGQQAVVGVDVGKSELTLCLVWPDREFERPWRVKSPGQIRLAILKLLELKRVCPVTVAMESSGTYGDAFGQGLDDAGLAVHRVSGKAVKDDSEGIEGVPSKHDGNDAAIIGTLCVNGRSRVWPWHGAKKDKSAQDESALRDQAIRYWVSPFISPCAIRPYGRLEKASAKTLWRSAWLSPQPKGFEPQRRRDAEKTTRRIKDSVTSENQTGWTLFRVFALAFCRLNRTAFNRAKFYI